MIKYLGSKRVLLPRIVAAIGGLPGVRTVLDLFSGTARVGHALKRAGLRVTANDHLAFAHVLARCYVQADARDVRRPAERLLRELSAVPPRAGYFTETFCVRARFFHPKNGERIDAIREAIAARGLEPDLEAVALTSLMEAADRVDSTTGVQMAYLKEWAPRALGDLELRLPDVLPGGGAAVRMEAVDAAGIASDAAYIDPPYNQHSYLGNYHVWETLVRWDAPGTYGTACKRVDCRAYRSPFNSKRAIRGALRDVLAALRARWIVVSFSDEGYLDRGAIESLLAERGCVDALEVDFKRYVGAQIGIYNPRGEKVGRVSHLRNKEILYFVGPDRRELERAKRRAALAAAPEQWQGVLPTLTETETTDEHG
jgi:adenine-specific DNA-methyltransferase